jgi:hypothetical protein
MDHVGELVLESTAAELLRDGLRLNIARRLTGLAVPRLRKLATDVLGAAPEPTFGPHASRVARLHTLGGILHTALLMGAVDMVAQVDGTRLPFRTRRDVIVFHAAWLSYRRSVDTGLVPYPAEVFDVNAACSIFLERERLYADVCRDCDVKLWRADMSKAARSCPVCCHARRLGVGEFTRAPLETAGRHLAKPHGISGRLAGRRMAGPPADDASMATVGPAGWLASVALDRMFAAE